MIKPSIAYQRLRDTHLTWNLETFVARNFSAFERGYELWTFHAVTELLIGYLYGLYTGVVPDGTYEVCSRTTGQPSAGRFF